MGTVRHRPADHERHGVGHGQYLRQMEYSEFPGPDTIFKNASLEQEQTVKAHASLDLTNDNKLIVGGMVKRADFNIDIWNIPDTLRTYAGSNDVIGSVDMNPATGNPITWQQTAFGRNVAYNTAHSFVHTASF